MNTYYIGVMSGTSLDGVDVVLCAIHQDRCTVLFSHEHPFPQSLKNTVLHCIAHRVSLADVGVLHHRLGQLFSQAVNTLLAEACIAPDAVEAIGLHGQTLWHEPNGSYPFSMQLGDAAIVAVETGIDVVSDFRSKDLSLGGQGAPFAPVFHHFLFANLHGVSAVVNIGGMANITIIDDPLQGYDTGPGNVLLDLWIQRHQNVAFDRDGAWAQSGNVHSELLKRMLQEPYFLQPPPKSTGREHFNETWITNRLAHLHVTPADVQATLLALTVHTIADAVHNSTAIRLLLCGGGAKNGTLVAQLCARLEDIEVNRTDTYGVSSDMMEAMTFAWLAYKRLRHESVPLHNVTGAKRNTILGAVYASR